jgi:hypothetical protein
VRRSEQTSPRPLIRRQWTAEQADNWSREDWIAIVLSPLVFAFFMIGLAKLLLGQISGVVLTVTAAVLCGLVYWVIDPKLRAVSSEYEKKQADYAAHLDAGTRDWLAAGSTGNAR